MQVKRPDRRHAALAAVLLALIAFSLLAGGEALRISGQQGPQEPAISGVPIEVDPDAAGADVRLAGPGSSGPLGTSADDRPGPGPGVVIGRIFDARSGLPIRDAGVTLLELGRRTITLPDGQFRFDGISPAAHTLVIGPAEGYLPASRTVRVLGEGADLGALPLSPTSAPTLVLPEYGGRVVACGSTQVSIPSASLMEASPLQLTCIAGADALPAPAPPGRLPLAAVDLAPGELPLVRPARLEIDLPPQPRYSPGVTLDLLRLDLDRLIWTPIGELVVTEGGRSAAGEITALGTYMAAAPPFGTFANASGDAPSLTRLNTSTRPSGEPSATLPSGSSLVYLSFDYARMAGTPIRIRSVNADGEILYELERRFEGEGREDIAMSAGTGPWPAGDYVTTVYVGSPPEIRSIEWRVGGGPAGDAPVAALGLSPGSSGGASGAAAIASPVAPILDGSSRPPPAAVMPVAGCKVPAGWFAYRVVAGETLSGIARRTGSSVAELTAANCLEADHILAGQAIFLPTIPAKIQPPAPKPVYPTALPPFDPRPTRPAGGGPSVTQPAGLPRPTIKATRPPDPTLAPRPSYPTVDPGAFAPPAPTQPPPAAPEPGIRRQPGAPAQPEPPKPTRPPDPTLAPRPTPPPLP